MGADKVKHVPHCTGPSGIPGVRPALHGGFARPQTGEQQISGDIKPTSLTRLISASGNRAPVGLDAQDTGIFAG